MKSEQKDTNLLMKAENKTLVMEYDILKRVSSCALRHNTEGRNVTLLLLVYRLCSLYLTCNGVQYLRAIKYNVPNAITYGDNNSVLFFGVKCRSRSRSTAMSLAT